MSPHEDAAERALTEALSRRLPRRAAPEALKRRLEEQIARSSATSSPSPRTRRSPSVRAVVPALAVGLALAAGVALYYERVVLPRAQATAQLETEAVNDHLRILYSERPLEVQSGGLHQVKPWFSGRLDFAPVVAFAGDDDFPLQGGAVSYFLDRKAAAFVFKRRLHTISLFVFRSDGLALPTGALVPMGRVQARAARVRGFNVLLWRDGELGYALVSDVDAADLAALGAKIEPSHDGASGSEPRPKPRAPAEP
jgi:anti-sigma factor RsiW